MQHPQDPAHIYLSSLSIWEIAHRANGVAPDGIDASTAQSEVGETIRQLLLGMNWYLNAYDANDDLISTGELWFAGLRKTKFAKKLERCLNQRTYEKAFLNGVFIHKEELPKWCISSGMPLPAFWFDASEVAEVDACIGRLPVAAPLAPAKPKTSRPEQLDKEYCQQAAIRLWKLHSDMTIAAMIRHEEVQKAGGKNYKEKTLRGWLSAVAPPQVKGKRGRPRNPEAA